MKVAALGSTTIVVTILMIIGTAYKGIGKHIIEAKRGGVSPPPRVIGDAARSDGEPRDCEDE